MAYQIIPMFDRVLIRRPKQVDLGEIKEDGSAVTKSGLHVAASSVTLMPEFEVVSIGAGCTRLKEQGVKPGDMVLLGQFSGHEFQDHMLVYEEEILAKLVDLVAEHERELQEFVDGETDESPVES